MKRLLILGIGTAVLASFASAQVSFSVGTYMPRDAAVKNIFGESSFAWGFGLGAAVREGRAGAGLDVSALSLSATNNRFFSIGATYGYELQSGQGTDVLSYVRAGTGLAYYDYNLNVGAVNSKSKSFKPLTIAEAGVVFSNRITVSAQYLFMPKMDGFDFSGLRLQAMYAFK
ncbi:MAG TPA: hypothetical protein VK171_01790 [Fimbriimonas sp.]|nr:hypothetical protein [Fimbriimonas sp.]